MFHRENFSATSEVVSDGPVCGDESHHVLRSHTANRPTSFHSDANKSQNLNLNKTLDLKLINYQNGNKYAAQFAIKLLTTEALKKQATHSMSDQEARKQIVGKHQTQQGTDREKDGTHKRTTKTCKLRTFIELNWEQKHNFGRKTKDLDKCVDFFFVSHRH